MKQGAEISVSVESLRDGWGNELPRRCRQSFALPGTANACCVSFGTPTILRETSEGTSYQTVRLVFRP